MAAAATSSKSGYIKATLRSSFFVWGRLACGIRWYRRSSRKGKWQTSSRKKGKEGKKGYAPLLPVGSPFFAMTRLTTAPSAFPQGKATLNGRWVGMDNRLFRPIYPHLSPQTPRFFALHWGKISHRTVPALSKTPLHAGILPPFLGEHPRAHSPAHLQ